MFQVTGCSHRTGHVGLRERLALDMGQATAFLNRFQVRYPESEAVLLSTCNRTEFYAASRHAWFGPGLDEMRWLLAESCDLNAGELKKHLFDFRGREAIAHLFSVAAGLDSMLIGETEILGQVRQAYRLASHIQPAMTVTHRIFQRAINVARRVARETGINGNRTSIPSLAVGGLAAKILGPLNGRTILVMGAGEMADKTLNYVCGLGANRLLVTNRTFELARQLAARHSGTAVDWDRLPEHLTAADLVVSVTGAQQPVVTDRGFNRILLNRSTRSLVILDLAIPRDFEPSIGRHKNVHLFSIDDLRELCAENIALRHGCLPAALEIVNQETHSLNQEMNDRRRHRHVDPVCGVAAELSLNSLAANPG